MAISRSTAQFDLPLRYGCLFIFVPSIILFPIWISCNNRGGIISLGITSTIIAAFTSAYIILFGTGGKSAVVGAWPRRSTSASPEVFRWWGRMFKPASPDIVAAIDFALLIFYLATLIEFINDLKSYHWGGMDVLGAYCIMMLTCSCFIHAFFTARNIFRGIVTYGRRAFSLRRRRAARQALVLCPNCGTHVIGEDAAAAGTRPSRENMSFYERIMGVEDDSVAERLLIGDDAESARPADEYKDCVTAEPQQSGVVVGETAAAASAAGEEARPAGNGSGLYDDGA